MEKLARTQYSPEFRVTADSKHNLPIAANVLKRKFAVNAPNPAPTQPGSATLAIFILTKAICHLLHLHSDTMQHCSPLNPFSLIHSRG